MVCGGGDPGNNAGIGGSNKVSQKYTLYHYIVSSNDLSRNILLTIKDQNAEPPVVKEEEKP